MLHKMVSLALATMLAAVCLSAQDRNLNASKNDWEEINFEYNSSVLVDGFPSLLRLGELLQRNPGFKVSIEGHTDRLGSTTYNDRLGLARANAVRDFLLKYGATAGQLTVATRGKAAEKYPGSKNTYSRTDEARWMNRRVVLTVSDNQGRTVSDGSAGEAIRAIEPPKPVAQATAPAPDCCNEVLKRLDKLDEIAQMLRDLAAQNAALRKEVDDLKGAQQSLQAKVEQTPKPPTTDEVASAVSAEIEKKKDPRFELLGLNVGENSNADVTFTGKGRFFAPFGQGYAFQTQGEYYYSKGQKEGQFDLGLVDRIGRFQAGLFSSFKHVTLAGDQTGGTLGQGSVTLDYIFKWGRIGVFGTKGFLDNALVNRTNLITPTGAIDSNVIFERYLKVVDTAGLSTSVGLFGNNYLEGNVGYLKSVTAGDRAGGTLRFIFPLNTKIALTLEGGVNETLLGAGNTGRAVVGVQFGNMMRPKEFLAANHAIPVDVPRVRYEVLTKRVQIGNSPPVADAGPNQIGVAAGTITLNGSASYDPDGNPITYLWTQTAGPAIVLSSPTKAITTFSAAAGESYAFRLTVTDTYGAQGVARTLVTTSGGKPVIVSFTANPTQINLGQSSTLTWAVNNADNVTITALGKVQTSGTARVSPIVTTTYTLTATNGGGAPVTASATVTVVSTPTLTACTASPTNVTAGQAATLNYQSSNATSVNITPGVGSGPLQGGVSVTPSQTTTYTIVATGASGTASCSVVVNVTPVGMPKIVSFAANPTTINAGQSSTLTWVVQNADSVTITSLGSVALNGSQAVSPTVTTTYTLTATNAAGPVTAQATVTVNSAPSITSFTATPPTSPSPGSPVVLACVVANANSLTISGTAATISNNKVTVNPTQDTTYTCVATNQSGQSASQSVTVKVTPAPPPAGPTVVIAGGNSVDTIYRFNYPDASASFSPQGNAPLTYHWTDEHNSSAILNPDSATPVLQLGLIGGLYYFDVTVTDSKGNSTTVVYTINFHNVKVN